MRGSENLSSSRSLEIVIKSGPPDRPKVAAAIQQLARKHQLPDRVVQAADLALEEYLSNLTTYSFVGRPEHEIKIRFTIGSDLLIEVEDDGPPFNPLTVSPVDTGAPLDTRPIGGLGVHLMRDFMDGLEYSTVAGRNILRMRKRLKP